MVMSVRGEFACVDACLVSAISVYKKEVVSQPAAQERGRWIAEREGVQGLTCEEEGVMCISGRVLLRLEQRIKVPETAVSTHS